MTNYISVVTATYNRGDLLYRVYDSLLKQTYHEFEWIIIDDGSSDNTRSVVEDWIKSDKIRIRYHYKSNAGKHVAINQAVTMAKGEWIVIADSDDAFLANALEFMLQKYEEIPQKDRDYYKGIACRCFDEKQTKILGSDFPEGKSIFDCKENDFKYKYKIRGELWGMTKRKVMQEYPFEEIKNAKFYPESIIWDQIAEKYVTRYVNVPLRLYYRDAANSVTKMKRSSRCQENFYLWKHHINCNSRYFIYSPKLVVKSYIGFSMDTFLCHISYGESLRQINGIIKKIFYILGTPLGYMQYRSRRE